MSATISISSGTLYNYPIPSIGSDDIANSKVDFTTSTSIKDICDAYKKLFYPPDELDSKEVGLYYNICNKLLAQFNKILGKLGTNRNYNFNLNEGLPLEEIFDENELSANCKEGKKSYQYYLRQIINNLNSLNATLINAQNTIKQLENLTASTEQNLNNKSHSLITTLHILDNSAQDIIKKFSEYAVVKQITSYTKTLSYDIPIDISNLDFNKFFDGTTPESYEVIEPAYKDLNSEELSKLNNIESLNDLRNLQTEKQFRVRKTVYAYISNDAMATNKYDPLAQLEVKYHTEENPEKGKSSELSNIKLFDELTLLEKLEYIVLYYKHNTEPYIFPNDDVFGYPCVKPNDSASATEDTNEIGNLELFYIGYIINRNGPIDAFASFMEIKSSAIRQQITLLSYRVKALKFYLNLVNRGLEEMQKSQSDGDNPIPVSSYYILRYVAANTTRTLMYLKDEEGNYLKDKNENELTDPYIVLQYSSDSPSKEHTKEINDTTYHLTHDNSYILIKATNDGINEFISQCNNCNKKLDNIFSNEVNNSFSDSIIGTNIYKEVESGNNALKLTCENYNVLFLHFTDENSSLKQLPKELETSKVDVSKVTGKFADNLTWDNVPSNKDEKSSWTTFINTWKSCFDTCIENEKSQLEYVEKSISSLRQKINTFDQTSTNFRNKAYTIYNNIINKTK